MLNRYRLQQSPMDSACPIAIPMSKYHVTASWKKIKVDSHSNHIPIGSICHFPLWIVLRKKMSKAAGLVVALLLIPLSIKFHSISLLDKLCSPSLNSLQVFTLPDLSYQKSNWLFSARQAPSWQIRPHRSIGAGSASGAVAFELVTFA